ncbi:TonB-dependent receptor [Bacteroides sp. ET336]|uniref:SusC/RagA family TonB-linked outer membrane protein n=2 Tax=Bacteroides TaxID=816 RepID=UPI0021AC3CE1|nr:TonB-dependent receptor [Bacteroides sp. ET336]MCR8894762.1 TonB-dependent receptor [Bacteroides sp. ET336]MDN0059258.1 TonB-dependent receptor [Bacteroides caecigallinarum]
MKRKLMLLMTCLFIGIGLVNAQVSKVTGTVTSHEDGLPVVGASVLVKGTTVGTVTDIDGNFTITNVPSSAGTLVISFIGMKSQEVDIKPVVNVVLHSDTELLDEVVVVGYGSGKKLGSVVGSIAAVGNEKIKNVPTANFSDALSGQVSGLSVLSSSGDPTAVASIRLRGVNSINAGTTPLFVLDGAPISSTVFNSLNPNDIESITVLKDAASTSIYGSRAANGVIVITSKKGKLNQDANVTLRAQFGFSSIVADGAEMMNSEQYIKFREMMNQPVSQEIKDLVQNYGISTNWRDEIFDGSAPTYNLDASINGGGEKISYFLSLNHMNQEGIIDQSGVRRESLRFNMDSRVKDWLKVGLQSNLAFTQYEQNNEINASGLYATNPAMFARMAMPFDSPYYYHFDENKNIVYGDKAEYLHYSQMPTPGYINSNRDVQRRRVSANINLYEELTPVRGLTLRAQQSVDAYDYTLSNQGFPTETLETPMGDTYQGATGYRQESYSRYYSFTYTNTAEYKFNIDRHNISALLGQESIISRTNGFGVFTEGHTDIRQMKLTQGTTVGIGDLSHSLVETIFNSYFLNASYNYDSKYYLDFSFRRDGSSKFAPDNRWANFFAVGAMWDLKKEDFLSDVDWLNNLSLKASYGTTGNSSIDDYMYFGLLGSGSNYNGSSSLGISQPSNYDLTWETVASTNVGLSFRLFDRVSADVEFYNKKTTDMLMQIPYSYTTGYGSGYGNIGSMVNRGVDVSVSYDILKSRDFYWSVRANFNYNKNEITELFNGRDEYALPDYGLMYKVGHSVGELYFVRRAGVDPNTGEQMWYDKDGNITKVFNEERDAVLLGKDQFAPWTGGFGTQFMWKGLSVNADFAWAAKKYMMSNDRYFMENPGQAADFNQTTAMLDMWTTPGQITDIPRYDQAIQFDDHLVENASFLRLKNITVQYSLPSKVMSKTGFFKNMSVFFTGRNLLTITKFTGYDPEPDSNLVKFFYPNTKQYVFGVELTF